MKRIYLVCLVLLVTVSLALAADFWESKPYTEWSAKEATRLMSDSPWAQTLVFRKANMTQVRREFGKKADSAGEGEGTLNPEVDYSISIRTALPVREAVARTAAIQQKYEQMNAEAKAAFDKRWASYLSAPVPDKVIFNVKYSATASDVDRQLAYYWQAQTLATVKEFAYMTGPDGKRVEAVAFFTGKGAVREFQIAFPRPVEAEGGDGSIAVEFKHPDVTEQPTTRVYVKFSFKSMKYNGKLTY